MSEAPKITMPEADARVSGSSIHLSFTLPALPTNLYSEEKLLAAYVAGMEAAAQIAEKECLGANQNDDPSDRWYDIACNDCAAAIRRAAEGAIKS